MEMLSLQVPDVPNDGHASFDDTVSSMLPLERLARERDNLRASYEAARPYPHIVMDGFFDPAVLDRAVEEFPDPDRRDWSRFDTDAEIKETSRGIANLTPFTQMLMLQLCSEPFLEHIRYITGIKDLIWDPMFFGAGLHESPRGGWLNIHADWTGHAHLPLKRRLNLILYLNRDWEEDWGGALDLCDPATGEAGTSVLPVFNRAVLFPTTDKTLHGFPRPLTCPAHRTRKSISIFYWSADPEALKTATQIRFLPGNRDTKMRALARSLVPPILLRTARQMSRGMRGA